MVTPYDWQENLGNRMRYVEGRLETGIPVAAVSIPDGILIASFRYQSNKVFEIYDRIAFAAIGLQSDVENIRVAAIEYCHQEGFRRSEEDVTIQRLVTQLSSPLKRAFGDMRTAPIVIRALFAEVDDDPDHDRFYSLDYDGDYTIEKHRILLAGTEKSAFDMSESLDGFNCLTASLDEAKTRLREVVLAGLDHEAREATTGDQPEMTFECALLRRDPNRTRRFARLEGAIV